jgi:RecB family exonuclease
VITPRSTRLLRVPDLAAFRTTLTDIAGSLTLTEARDTFVLVPTRAAAEQLRRTFEDRLLTTRETLVLPVLGTRGDWYNELAARFPLAPRLLNAFEREAILAAVARGLVAQGVRPPFEIRPGLLAEMLDLYDMVRRLGRTVADFDRNLREELEKDRETDRGAEKLWQQTVFLTALYQGYEARAAAAGVIDEHGLRARVIESKETQSLRRIVITVADRIADPDGLWPSDYELLTQLPHLESIDIVCTEAVLASGFLERLYGVLPELHDERVGEPSAPPLLVVPGSGGALAPPTAPPTFTYRDREEELSGVARRLKAERGKSPLERTALVVRRPLPYLYLARDVFGGAGISFETLDTLPLAAEPYAAAVDLALEAVTSDFTRTSVLALLRSPHFDFGDTVPDRAVAALDFALADARYLGGLDRLEQLAREWSENTVAASREERRRKSAAPAAAAAAAALRGLAALGTPRPLADQIDTLVMWLRRFDRPPSSDTHPRAPGAPSAPDLTSRRLRVRAAVLDALASLAGASRAHEGDATSDVTVLSAAVRRWLGSQTFAVSTGEPGLQIVDAQAARFGDFDDVQLLGMIDGEWPEPYRRNVLYPSSLLAQLEPLPMNPDPGRRERDALNAARAAFKDLMHLPRTRVRVSNFLLENDAVVEPSILLDEIETLRLTRETAAEPAIRVFHAEALSLEPRKAEVLGDMARRWAAARMDADVDAARFRGEAGPWMLPRVSVSRLERYLDCPFRFFASEVLRLEEQPEDEDTRTPLERGRFLHELFERFFHEWQKRGHRRIDAGSLPEAREVFAGVCEAMLAGLSASEATLERTRLLGSAVSAGIAHRVFAMEAQRAIDVVERLLEYPLKGDFHFRASDGRERTVTLSAKTDRIDLLADGTLRVIDYKSRKTPDLKVALQLPIYSHCARVSLDGHRGRQWTLGEALYVSFEGDRPVVPFKAKGRTVDDLIGDAQDRLLTTLDRIAEGRFPAQPLKKSLCGPCPYVAVCRLEYVEADDV